MEGILARIYGGIPRHGNPWSAVNGTINGFLYKMIKAEVCAVSWVTGRNYTIQDSTASAKRKQPQEQAGFGFSSPLIQIICAYFTVLLIASAFLIWTMNMVAEKNNCNDSDNDGTSSGGGEMADLKVVRERGIKKDENKRQHKKGRKQVKLVQGGKQDGFTWVPTKSAVQASPPALAALELSSEEGEHERYVFISLPVEYTLDVGREEAGDISFASDI